MYSPKKMSNVFPLSFNLHVVSEILCTSVHWSFYIVCCNYSVDSGFAVFPWTINFNTAQYSILSIFINAVIVET